MYYIFVYSPLQLGKILEAIRIDHMTLGNNTILLRLYHHANNNGTTHYSGNVVIYFSREIPASASCNISHKRLKLRFPLVMNRYRFIGQMILCRLDEYLENCSKYEFLCSLNYNLSQLISFLYLWQQPGVTTTIV